MTDIALHHEFDSLRQVDPAGREFWSSRALAPLADYDRWENFASALDRAKATCENVGLDTADHFRDATKMVEVGSGASRHVLDVHLSRYGAYLVFMNGDPRKLAIAAAQTYFAAQTRIAETQPARRELSRLELIDLARDAEVGRLEAEAQLAIAGPKAEAFDDFLTAEGDYLVGTVANMLGLGQNTLYRRLRDEHILICKGARHNTPYQQYMHHFRVVARTFEDEGVSRSSFTTYVRPSGVDFIRKVLKLQALAPAVAS